MSAAPRSLLDALTALGDARAAIDAHDDPAFQQRLGELRAWQSARVAQFHSERAAAHGGEDLLDFLTRRFYLEGDWSELTRHPSRVANAVGRLVKNDRPLVLALELQAVADRLDVDMADAMLADRRLAPNQPITPYAYLRAIRRVGRHDERRRQIDWLDRLISEVAGFADSKAAWWAFKLAGPPAHTLGMGRTYDLLADGFAAMRACDDMETATRLVVEAQNARLERLLGSPWSPR